MTLTTLRRLALVLCNFPMVALSSPTDLTCKWTSPKNSGQTESLTMTVDSASSTVSISRGATNSVVFSAAEIRFNVRDAKSWDWKYVLNRTTLVLGEKNYTGSHAPIDYACALVARKV